MRTFVGAPLRPGRPIAYRHGNTPHVVCRFGRTMMGPSIPFNSSSAAWPNHANSTDQVQRRGSLRFHLIGGLIYNGTMTVALAAASWSLFTWLLTP